MKNTEYPCPSWYPLFYIILDFFLYSIFFLILNALLPRQYGPQLFKIKELFSKKKKKNIILVETRGSDNGENDHAETVIKVKNLTKKYKQMKDEFALQNVPFDIKKGEVIFIVGPNGAGKSTIINCLSGIIHQTEGVISISFVIRTPRFVFLRRHSKKRFLFFFFSEVPKPIFIRNYKKRFFFQELFGQLIIYLEGVMVQQMKLN